MGQKLSTTEAMRARSGRFNPWRFLKIGLFVLISLALVSTFVLYLMGRHYGANWTLLDCLFMVVITLSTIGYGDWLHLEGKDYVAAEFFIMFLGIIGIGVPAFVISNVTALIVDGIFSDTFRRRRMDQELAKLSGHVIVCGAGATGVHCIEEMLKLGRKVVVVDRDAERLKDLQHVLGDFLFIVGAAEHDDVLKQAGITRAFGLITCLTDDKENLFITLSARVLNPSLRIVSKGIDDHVSKKMITAGADSVVSPTAIGGLRLVSEMIRPTTVSFLDCMLRDRTNVRFDELKVQAQSPLIGKSLAECKLNQHGDVLVVAARRPASEQFIYNPKPDFVLEAESVIVVLGAFNEVDKLRPAFDGKTASAVLKTQKS